MPDTTDVNTHKPTQAPDSAPESQTPVSDKQVKPDGTGVHGRPTDDSDPGHS